MSEARKGPMEKVSVAQVADLVRRLSPQELQELVHLVPELKRPFRLTATFEHHPEHGGYLAKCPEIDAVAWGSSLREAQEELVDAVIETAEALIENCPNPGPELAERLPYADLVYQHRHSRASVREVLGLGDDGSL